MRKMNEVSCALKRTFAEFFDYEMIAAPFQGARSGKAAAFLAAIFLTAGLLCLPDSVYGDHPGAFLEFDGDTYVQTDVNAGDLGIAGDAARTAEVWVNTEAFVYHGGIFSMGGLHADGRDFSFLSIQDNHWRSQLWGGYDINFDYQAKGEWAHFAIVYTGSEVIIYADGEEIAREDRELNTAPYEPIRIGRWAGNGFEGYIADFRLWDRALSEEEINANMDRLLDGDEEGLVGYWPLNDGAGNVARDRVAGNDGAIEGVPLWYPSYLVGEKPSSIDSSPLETVTFGPIELAEPEGDVSFQWFFNGEPIEGAEESSLVLEEITFDDLGEYHVMIDDDREQTPVESRRMKLNMPDARIWETNLDKARNVKIGDTVELGPAELSDPTGDVEYQWYFNKEPIEGATDAVLTIEDISEEEFGMYQVKISDDLRRRRPAVSGRVLITLCPRTH